MRWLLIAAAVIFFYVYSEIESKVAGVAALRNEIEAKREQPAPAGLESDYADL